ncbi:unnamed protein product [Paramecium octaurelia]|uniref:Transmembrane protein n=1 Tax=Paramecium octaurelia TaxID=43137 RepID=A0A8S1UVR7_PAROT|nr:unnamed protein product [Paramecium octaurelia]
MAIILSITEYLNVLFSITTITNYNFGIFKIIALLLVVNLFKQLKNRIVFVKFLIILHFQIYKNQYELQSQCKQTSIELLAKQNKVAFLITKFGDDSCMYKVKLKSVKQCKIIFQTVLHFYIASLIPLSIQDYHGQNVNVPFKLINHIDLKRILACSSFKRTIFRWQNLIQTLTIVQLNQGYQYILELYDIKVQMILNNQFQIISKNKFSWIYQIFQNYKLITFNHKT